MSGSEYKSHVLNNVCATKWHADSVIHLANMFRYIMLYVYAFVIQYHLFVTSLSVDMVSCVFSCVHLHLGVLFVLRRDVPMSSDELKFVLDKIIR